MGYDFSFVRLEPRPTSFPFRAPNDFDGRFNPFTSPRALEARLESSGFRVSPRGDYSWDAPEGGGLTLFVYDDWLSVDTHAHWKYVLGVYELLRELEPELLVFDKQTGMFYDEPSYRRFVDPSCGELR